MCRLDCVDSHTSNMDNRTGNVESYTSNFYCHTDNVDIPNIDSHTLNMFKC